jgi:addiction module RelE/StbE family toxin
MFELQYGSAVKKDLEALPKKVAELIQRTFGKIKTNPYEAGEKLHGSLKHFYSAHVHAERVQYRIVYQIVAKQCVVIVVMVASRENVYEKIKRRV